MEKANLDPACLRAFITVVDSRSFTAAAARLLRGQSAVSLQVRRLEEQLGVRLLDRGPRHVGLSAEGELVIDQARRLLALNDDMVSRAQEPELAGVVRLGVPEDFATMRLPQMLSGFVRAHPRVSLEVTCELTRDLLSRFDLGEFDLVLVKRKPSGPVSSPDIGQRVWRENMVWTAGSSSYLPPADEPLPLVCSPRPCVLRHLATRALDATGRTWRIAYSCGSLAGNYAALRAGLGVAALPFDMVPADLVVLGDADLPDLPDIETVLVESAGLSAPALRLRDTIRRELEHGPIVS